MVGADGEIGEEGVGEGSGEVGEGGGSEGLGEGGGRGGGREGHLEGYGIVTMPILSLRYHTIPPGGRGCLV